MEQIGAPPIKGIVRRESAWKTPTWTRPGRPAGRPTRCTTCAAWRVPLPAAARRGRHGRGLPRLEGGRRRPGRRQGADDQLASSQSYIDRFYREAKSGKLLNHPNIVRTLDYGQDEKTGKHYLVLEFVDGPSAHALLDRLGRLPVGDAVHIALDVARALEHAHSRNIIHRDIKPDNILVTRSGVAKLADLGLAKRTDETSHLTSTRQGFGTTAYMPYEQAVAARSADNRSDIYALGATLYHLVVGAAPFPGDSHLDVVEKKRLGDFPPAGSISPEAPAALDAILARMMARQPRDRYQTASELIVDLERSRLSSPLPTFADPELAKKTRGCGRAWRPRRSRRARPGAAPATRAPAPRKPTTCGWCASATGPAASARPRPPPARSSPGSRRPRRPADRGPAAGAGPFLPAGPFRRV